MKTSVKKAPVKKLAVKPAAGKAVKARTKRQPSEEVMVRKRSAALGKSIVVQEIIK